MEKHKGWRPTDYSEEILQKARQYLEKCNDDYELMKNTEVTQTKTIEWLSFEEKKETKLLKLKVKLPTIDWLAKYINVNKSTIYEWLKKSEYVEFSNLYNELMEEQAERLINMSLSNDYNSSISKLLLTKHWYIEKSEVEETKKINLESKDINEKSLEDIQDYINSKLN